MPTARRAGVACDQLMYLTVLHTPSASRHLHRHLRFSAAATAWCCPVAGLGIRCFNATLLPLLRRRSCSIGKSPTYRGCEQSSWVSVLLSLRCGSCTCSVEQITSHSRCSRHTPATYASSLLYGHPCRTTNRLKNQVRAVRICFRILKHGTSAGFLPAGCRRRWLMI